MNFFIVHQYAGNKGDRAVLVATCKLLRESFPDCKITVSTSNPSLWKSGIPGEQDILFIPKAWEYENIETSNTYWKYLQKMKKYTFTIMRESFLKGIRLNKLLVNPSFNLALESADVVISVGGHHFTTLLSRDLVSSINFDAMAALSRKPIICFSQSFGPFDFHNPRNEKVTRQILKQCNLLAREDNSKEALESLMGKESDILTTHETVLALSNFVHYRPILNREKVVGISIYSTQKRTPKEKEKYIKLISNFCDFVIEKGYSVKFFPMEIHNTEPDDRPFINQIGEAIRHQDKYTIQTDDLETLNHLEEISKCSIFLGHKTHSTIFALATGTPLIAIAYHPKTLEFMKQFGMEENAIEESNLEIDLLCKTFERLEKNLEKVSEEEFNRALKVSQKIKSDLYNSIKLLNT